MNPTDFHALETGPIFGSDDRRTVEALGSIVVPSGLLEASDPFVNLGDSVTFTIPAGTYPVFVTAVESDDERGGRRESYLSVVLADGDVDRIDMLTPVGHEPGDFTRTVCVDAGTVAFADAVAVKRSTPGEERYDHLLDDGSDDSWFNLMDSPTHYVAGCANIVLPDATAGQNVVLSHSGWGDGFYPVLGSYDIDGNLLGVHIDLLVDVPDPADGDNER